ncbi:hypothetical protein ACLKA7_001030, partial [Drosophila subpalustris]
AKSARCEVVLREVQTEIAAEVLVVMEIELTLGTAAEVLVVMEIASTLGTSVLAAWFRVGGGVPHALP